MLPSDAQPTEPSDVQLLRLRISLAGSNLIQTHSRRSPENDFTALFFRVLTASWLHVSALFTTWTS